MKTCYRLACILSALLLSSPLLAAAPLAASNETNFVSVTYVTTPADSDHIPDSLQLFGGASDKYGNLASAHFYTIPINQTINIPITPTTPGGQSYNYVTLLNAVEVFGTEQTIIRLPSNCIAYGKTPAEKNHHPEKIVLKREILSNLHPLYTCSIIPLD